jgi:hypothetical protein
MEGKKNYLERYRIRQIICVILGICIALAATLILTASRMKQVDAKVARTQESLAKEVFRFHVLANSGSALCASPREGYGFTGRMVKKSRKGCFLIIRWNKPPVNCPPFVRKQKEKPHLNVHKSVVYW